MTLKHLLGTSALAPSVLLAGCQPATDSGSASAPSASEQASAELGSFGIALENMDTSVKPGDNFFRYVNGNWLNSTEIPADKSNYGSFNILADRSNDRVKAIIESSAGKSAAAGTEEQKIGDFYAAFMDMDAINAAGLAPVQADLKLIADVPTHEAAAKLMGTPELGIRAPVGGWVDVDFKDIENYIFLSLIHI